MNLIGEKLCKARKSKGLTQEELAENSQVNLRTIQRIENNQTNPRGKTLGLICEILGLNLQDLLYESQHLHSKTAAEKVVNGVFLLLLNLVLMAVVGFLTLDSNANLNSRFGGLLLSFLLPFFIVVFTKEMTAIERLLKFGSGYLVYFVLVLIINGFPVGFVSGLFPSLFVSLTVLYFGTKLMPKR